MPILLLAPGSGETNYSESLVTAKLVNGFIRARFEVDVVSQSDFCVGQLLHDHSTLYESLKGRVTGIRGTSDGPVTSLGAKLKACWNSRQAISGVVWVDRAHRCVREKHRRTPYQVILSRALPGYAHLAGLRLTRETGVPWIACWNDPWPPERAPTPYGRGPTASISWAYRRFLNAVALGAAWHVFPCERLRRYVLQYVPAIESRSSVIPHIAMASAVEPGPTRDGRFTLCHAGGLHPERTLQCFLAGLSSFLESLGDRRQVCVQMVGVVPPAAKQQIESFGLTANLQLAGFRPYDESQQMVAAADVAVLIEAASQEGVFFPSKFVDYVQTGRPILAVSPRVGTVSDILAAHGGGIVADCRDPQPVAKAIQTLYEAWRRGSLDQHFGARHLVEMFSEERVVGLYRILFAQLGVNSEAAAR